MAVNTALDKCNGCSVWEGGDTLSCLSLTAFDTVWSDGGHI